MDGLSARAGGLAPGDGTSDYRGREIPSLKTVFVGSVAALAASQILLVFAAQNLYALLGALTLFFAGFNVMAAMLPSLITKTAPLDAKGTARASTQARNS